MKKEILKKYFKYRKDNEVKDEVIDNIFLKEIYWTNGVKDSEKVYLFKDFEAVINFFNVVDLDNHPGDNLPLKESGYCCGTMWRNSQICNDINEVIFTRIYEELEKRNFLIISNI